MTVLFYYQTFYAKSCMKKLFSHAQDIVMAFKNMLYCVNRANSARNWSARDPSLGTVVHIGQ